MSPRSPSGVTGHHAGKGHNFNFPLPMIGVTDDMYFETLNKVRTCP